MVTVRLWVQQLFPNLMEWGHHTQKHTLTHARLHACARTHTHTHPYLTPTRAQAHRGTPTGKEILTGTCTRTHRLIRSRSPTHTHTPYTHMRAGAQTHLRNAWAKHIHRCSLTTMRTRSNTHTAHTHARTCTHTHKCTTHRTYRYMNCTHNLTYANICTSMRTGSGFMNGGFMDEI